MLFIDADRCDGCGTCVQVCPSGAIHLENNKAVIAQELCRECGDCIEVCPREAISWEGVVAEEHPSPLAARSEAEVIRITQPEPAKPEPKSGWLPAVGAALSFLGREVMPRAIVWLLDTWEQREAKRQEARELSVIGEKRISKQRIALDRGDEHRHRHRHGAN